MDDEDAAGLRRAPVQARAKERIKRILDAAEQLFVEVGYNSATTNQVATRAQTSIGSIYEFFRNKQDLARGLTERYLSELDELYPAGDHADLDGTVGISTVVDSLHAFYGAHPALGPLLHGCRDSEELQSLADAIHTKIIRHVERIIAARREGLDPARRLLVAEMCAHLLLSVLDQATDKPSASQHELVAELKLLLTSYLASALPRR